MERHIVSEAGETSLMGLCSYHYSSTFACDYQPLLEQAGKQNKRGETALMLLMRNLFHGDAECHHLNEMARHFDVLLEKEAGLHNETGLTALDLLMEATEKLFNASVKQKPKAILLVTSMFQKLVDKEL